MISNIQKHTFFYLSIHLSYEKLKTNIKMYTPKGGVTNISCFSQPLAYLDKVYTVYQQFDSTSLSRLGNMAKDIDW